MKKINGRAFSTKGLLVLVFLFPILSCTTINEAIWPPTATPTPTATSTPTLTPTITPTSTAISLAGLDLEDIALRESDLPEGFTAADIDNEELLQKMVSSSDAMSTNLESGYANLFTSKDGALFINLLLLYQDAGSASDAYDSILEEQTGGDELDCPSIGEVCQGLVAEESGMTAYAITWRYHEAVVELAYAGQDDIGFDEMIRLAQVIQSRLETA